MGFFIAVGFLALWLWETDSVLERRYTGPLVFLGGVFSLVCFWEHGCVLILTCTRIVRAPEYIAIDTARTVFCTALSVPTPVLRKGALSITLVTMLGCLWFFGTVKWFPLITLSLDEWKLVKLLVSYYYQKRNGGDTCSSLGDPYNTSIIQTDGVLNTQQWRQNDKPERETVCLRPQSRPAADESVFYKNHENEKDECVDMSYEKNRVTINLHCGYLVKAVWKRMNALVDKNNRAIQWVDPFSSSGINTKYIENIVRSDIQPEPNDQDIVVHEKDALSYNFSKTKFTGLILVFPPEKSKVPYMVLKRAIQASNNIEYIVIVQEDLEGGDSCGNEQYWDLLATLPITRMKDVNGIFINSAKRKDGSGFRSCYYMLHL